MTHKFKVGDRVRYSGFSAGEGVVSYLLSKGEYDYTVLRDGAGSPLVFRESELELLGPEMTDQELADKWRELSRECLRIRETLESRGYRVFNSRDNLPLRGVNTYDTDAVWTFRKTETTSL